MEWFYTKRRGPEWKQGWTGQSLSSISTPPLHLLTIFAVVIVLLWFSQHTDYNAQLHHSAINFQLFLVLFPILFVLFMALYPPGGWLNSTFRQSVHEAAHRGGSPWGIAVLVVLVLVLLSYQSSFHSKWFGPLWRSG